MPVNKRERMAFKVMVSLLVLLVAIILAADALAMESITLMQVHASGGLNVRDFPSMDAWVIYTLENRETVSVLDVSDGWTLIARNFAPFTPFGWVCSNYLK